MFWREWVGVKSPGQASAVYFNINNALLFNGALFFYTSDCVLNLYIICSLNGKKSVLVYTAVKWICCLKSNRCVLFGWCKIALTCIHTHINSHFLTHWNIIYKKHSNQMVLFAYQTSWIQYTWNWSLLISLQLHSYSTTQSTHAQYT